MKKQKETDVIITSEILDVNQLKKRINVNDRFVLQALTSCGYDMYTAIYEELDNSKDAGATRVDVIYEKEKSRLTIIDDGKGMSREELMKAIDIGTSKEYYEEDNVGYFGVGLNSSIVNLFKKPTDIIRKKNLDEYNNIINSNIAYIDTNNGTERTRISWSPWISVFQVKEETSLRDTIGTTIIIENVNNFYPSVLKKNLGTIYYHSLKNGNFNIYVKTSFDEKDEDSKVQFNDPLYRYEPNIQTNFIDAKVCNEDIKLIAVQLEDQFERHSWDRDDKGFSYQKGGVYIEYGGRYIEYGGTFGVNPGMDPWHNHTRIELQIPKHLTDTFAIKFNKTNGLSSLDNPLLDDLRRKIKDLLNWGKKIRKRNGIKPSDEVINSIKELSDKLNKSAINAGFRKPITAETEKVKVGPFLANPNKVKKESKDDDIKPIIRKKKIYEVRTDDFGVDGPTWDFMIVNSMFTIILNTSSPFFREIYEKMNEENQFKIMKFVASLAYAQYESFKDDFSDKPQRFWRTFWADFTRYLNDILYS